MLQQRAEAAVSSSSTVLRNLRRSCRLVGNPGTWKAPRSQHRNSFGAVKYILALFQAFWSPTKLPYRGS